MQPRLSQVGIDVSQRSRELSSLTEPLLGEPVYVFNDWHAVMVFGLAGRDDLAERVITASGHSVGSNRFAQPTALREKRSSEAAVERAVEGRVLRGAGRRRSAPGAATCRG
jgi:hypothetical protein